jgi:hypothetical protein
MKNFDTASPCIPSDHQMVPVETIEEKGQAFLATLATGELTAEGEEKRQAFLAFLATLATGELTAEGEEKRQAFLAFLATLATGELTAEGQQTVLGLCYNAGTTYGNASPPNFEQALAHWQQGLQYAQAFLATGELTAEGQEAVLRLCLNAGVAYGNASPPNIEQELAHYAQGLQYAQAFLATGELTADGQETVLSLYDNRSVVWANNGLINQALVDLPLRNYLLWELASQFTPDQWQTWLRDQKNDLSHLISPQHFVTHSQHFFTQLLAQPDLFRHLRARVIGRRLLSPTEIFLRLAEGFYILDELQMRQGLTQAYQKLGLALDWRLAEQWQPTIGEPLESCLAQIKSQWIQLVKQEALPVARTGVLDLFTCQQKLASRPWYQKLFSRRRLQSLEADLANYQQLWQQDIELKMRHRWDQNRTQAETAQVEWLKSVLLKFLPLPAGLTDPAAIVLAAVAADLPIDADSPTPPQWQNPAKINEALKRSHLLEWAINYQETLWDWPQHLKSITLLSTGKQYPSQFRDALLAWQQGDYRIIFIYLQSAWINAQQQALPLAKLLTALQNPNLSTHLDVILDKGATEPSTRQAALTAIIQGKGQETLTHAIESWLAQQGWTNSINPSVVITGLQQRFERLSQIFPRTPPHSNWQEKVNQLAAQLLTETLTPQSPDLAQLWEILERARIAFVPLSQRTNLEAWFLTTGEELAPAFEQVLKIIAAYQGGPIPDHPWPPLATWLTRLEKLIPTPPSITDCQTHLAANEALVQPFFDQIQQSLRVLWLDNNGLQLRDLPTACAQEADWKGDNSVIAQWQQFVNNYKNNRWETRGYENWAEIMQQPAITTFADQLATWAQANQREQLTVIFPAPLGQLAWESLPSLENLLIREISLAHWLTTKTHSPSKKIASKRWLYSDPSGLQHCMVKEIQWLTKYLGGEATPQTTRLQALQQLATCDHIHLATHGLFQREQPLASYLSLDQQRDFPLWFATAIRLPTDLLVLSACESNLNGLDTQGLLTPIGIGPALAAAGANTVVGTLWEVPGAASFFFTYHFYQLIQAHPDLPWHQLTTRARWRLKTMSVREVEALIKEIKWDEGNQACQTEIKNYLKIAKLAKTPPFEDFWCWAGFHVLGGMNGEW